MDGSVNSHTFVEELHWCIGQLELGLQRLSPDSRQAADSIKVLKILQSQKAPIIKKRQVMRNVFGDYRKKMKEAEKKSLSGLRHSRIQSLGVVKSSRFLKMSYHKQQDVDHVRGDLQKNLSNLCLQSSVCEPSTSASQSTEELESNLPRDHQTSHAFVNSAKPGLINESTSVSTQIGEQEGIQSSGEITKVPLLCVSPKKSYIVNATASSSADTQSSNENCVASNTNISTVEASTSSYSKSSPLVKHGTSFKYEASDNSFIFQFENPENDDVNNKLELQTKAAPNGDANNKLKLLTKAAETAGLEKSNQVKAGEKTMINIFKYEKSDNDFSFNFQQSDDVL